MASNPQPKNRKAADAFAAFLDGLPEERRAEVDCVRGVIQKNLPTGYEEAVSGRMLVYQVPLVRYSDIYNGHPLWYIALSSEKSYLSLHLMPVYGSTALMTRLERGFADAGKKLEMGKACVHFTNADDLALDAIGEIVAAVPLDRWVEIAESARRR